MEFAFDIAGIFDLPWQKKRGRRTMNISYDLEFDMDSFLSDLERRQSARKRTRLEEVRKEVRRMKSERKHRSDRVDD
jgi:hypothetical protein